MFLQSRRVRTYLARLGILAGFLQGGWSAQAAEVYQFSRQPVHLAYADWEHAMKQADGTTQIRAEGTTGGGGILAAKSLNLTAQANEVLALTLKIAPGNQAETLQVRLVDSGFGQGAWDFPLTGLPVGQVVTVTAAGNAPLATPSHGTKKLNLSKVVQVQVQGSWLFNGVTAVDLLDVNTAPPAATPTTLSQPVPSKAAKETVLVHDFTKKENVSTFAFLGWNGHVASKDGATAVDVGKDGAFGGANFTRTAGNVDLRGHEDDSLALTLRVREGNATPAINIALWDAAKREGEPGHDGSWSFDISKVKAGETVRVVAKEAVSLVMGTKGHGPRSAWDLGNIKTFTVSPGYGNNAVAVDLLKLETEPVSAEMQGNRQVLAEQAVEQVVYGQTVYLPFDAITPVARSEQSPKVALTSLAAPDVLTLTIESGQVMLGKIVDYVPQPGDDIATKKLSAIFGEVDIFTLKRGGKDVGEIVGSGDKRQCITQPTFSGDPLQTVLADHPEGYTISSADDPNYAAATQPLTVHRKSKPTDQGMPKSPMRHVISLRLPKPLVEGKTYRIDCGQLNVQTPIISFRNDTAATRSLAVHTTQIGYRADDPFKRGYLSFWLGVSVWSKAGSVVSYPAGLKFQVLDDATGKEVFAGPVEMAKAATDEEFMFYNPGMKKAERGINYNGTDVLRMDFSAVNTPGKYRLHVDGVGCGYPFEIGPGTWDHAFWVQMRGFYHQRSGIALGPPYTNYVRPRDHHPDDGVPVILSKYVAPVWNEAKWDNFWQKLHALSTGQRVTNGWGGYHDAGDWNPRRITHMRATMAQLEIADLFPDYMAKVKLNIPQDYKNIPDLFNEVLFEIDCFRRMQTAEGSVGMGLETAGDPMGQVSWYSKVVPVYMLSPDIGSSWLYASVAGRAARLLKHYDAKLAAVYEESALKAMNWAEGEFARQCKEKGKTDADLIWTVRDGRNLAAIEMLRLTGDKHWHEVFMENTVLTQDNPELYAYGKAIQNDAAFAYAIAEEKLTDPVTRKRAIQGLEARAKIAAAYADGNAFDIVCEDRGRPMFISFYSNPWDGHIVLRAYHVTGKKEYLVAGLRATQFSSGANPENLVETTGLGLNPIKHPLWVDAAKSGQAVPEGITVYGIDDWHFGGDQGILVWYPLFPKYLKWPVTESYVDVGPAVMINEFTVDQSWTETTWTWGYLAARSVELGGR